MSSFLVKMNVMSGNCTNTPHTHSDMKCCVVQAKWWISPWDFRVESRYKLLTLKGT